MKLRCVDKFRSQDGKPITGEYPFPEIGDECESITSYPMNGKLYYQLVGYPEYADTMRCASPSSPTYPLMKWSRRKKKESQISNPHETTYHPPVSFFL